MSPRQVVVAEGGILDLDSVMEVMEDGFDPSYGEAWTAPQCAGLMPMPGVWLSIAWDGSEAVGFALARVVSGEAELLLLAVRRQRRRQGIGRLLLERFLQIARERGASRFHLEVRDGNQAIALYNQAGFTEVGRRRNYYTGKDSQVYDALTLARNSSS